MKIRTREAEVDTISGSIFIWPSLRVHKWNMFSSDSISGFRIKI